MFFLQSFHPFFFSCFFHPCFITHTFYNVFTHTFYKVFTRVFFSFFTRAFSRSDTHAFFHPCFLSPKTFCKVFIHVFFAKFTQTFFAHVFLSPIFSHTYFFHPTSFHPYFSPIFFTHTFCKVFTCTFFTHIFSTKCFLQNLNLILFHLSLVIGILSHILFFHPCFFIHTFKKVFTCTFSPILFSPIPFYKVFTYTLLQSFYPYFSPIFSIHTF